MDHTRALLLPHLDQVQIIVGNVIIVVLDLCKGTLMLLHQIINVSVLAFLNLMNLLLAPQLQVISEHLHFFLNEEGVQDKVDSCNQTLTFQGGVS
jgi:hypothetical protein